MNSKPYRGREMKSNSKPAPGNDPHPVRRNILTLRRWWWTSPWPSGSVAPWRPGMGCYFAYYCFLLTILWISATEAVQSITEIGTVAGSFVDIPCNTSWIEDEVSLVLWFRGDTGVPIYRVDARNVPLSKATHTTSDELRKRLQFDMSTQPPVLRINPVLPSDAAEYRCRVDFRQSRTQNVIVLLNVTVPPKELLIMDIEGQKLEGVIGPYDEDSNVILICEAEGGKPSPSVNWYRANRIIDSSYTMGPHGLVRNELNIRNLNRSDFMSILTCRASNNNVTEPISATVILDMNLRPLDVKILPKLYSKSKSSVVPMDSRIPFVLAAGSKAEFQCQSTGSRPAAQISWWLGSERLSSNVRDSVNEDGNATVSTIVFVPSIEDNGKMLTCRADNLPMPHTALKDERLLDVHFTPQLRISFGSNIQTDSIREGSDVYLECQVRANPPIKEVVWLHDDRPIHSLMAGDSDPSSGIGSTVIMTNQSLVIQKVHRSHRGRYQCVAFNEQGESVSDPLYLKVNFAPSCKPGQKMQYGVSRNEQIRIRCEMEAEPSSDLLFRWTLNTSGSETSVDWPAFTVNGTTSFATYRPESSLDYGTLICMAQNSIGSQQKPCIFSVVPAGRPDPVRGCAITNHSMNTLLVECIPGDDGGLRQHFNLEVYVGGTDSPATATMPATDPVSDGSTQKQQWSSSQNAKQRLHSSHNSSQPNFIVSSLTPGTPYTLVLYATNAKGRSHSVSLSAVTLSAPEKHIARGSFEQIVVHPILGILIGIVATIVIVVIILILLIRSRIRPGRAGDGQCHRRSRSLNNGGNVHDSTASDALMVANGDLKLKRIKNGQSNNASKDSKKKISPFKKPININGEKSILDGDKTSSKRQQLGASSTETDPLNGGADEENQPALPPGQEDVFGLLSVISPGGGGGGTASESNSNDKTRMVAAENLNDSSHRVPSSYSTKTSSNEPLSSLLNDNSNTQQQSGPDCDTGSGSSSMIPSSSELHGSHHIAPHGAIRTYAAARTKSPRHSVPVNGNGSLQAHHCGPPTLADLSSTASSTTGCSSSTSSSPRHGKSHHHPSMLPYQSQSSSPNPVQPYGASAAGQSSQYHHPYLNSQYMPSPYDPNMALYSSNNMYATSASPLKIPSSSTLYEQDPMNQSSLYDTSGANVSGELAQYAQTTVYVGPNTYMAAAATPSDLSIHHQSILYYNPNDGITVDNPTIPEKQIHSKRCSVTLVPSTAQDVAIDDPYVSLNKMSKVPVATAGNANSDNLCCCTNNSRGNSGMGSLAVKSMHNVGRNHHFSGASDEQRTSQLVMATNNYPTTNEDCSTGATASLHPDLKHGNGNSSNCDQPQQQQPQIYLRHPATNPSATAAMASAAEICLTNHNNKQQRNGTAV